MLASCLNDPGDLVSLLAVLKGMLFCVSDNALFHYKMEGFPINYTTLPNQAEVGEIAYPVYEALVRLAEYTAMIRRLPAISALLYIIEDLGMIPLAAVRQTGRARAGTLIAAASAAQGQPSCSKLAGTELVSNAGRKRSEARVRRSVRR